MSSRSRTRITLVLTWLALAAGIALVVLAFGLIGTAPATFYPLLFAGGVVATFALTGIFLERNRCHATRALADRPEWSVAVRVQAGPAFVRHLEQVAAAVSRGDLHIAIGRDPVYLLGGPAGLEVLNGRERLLTIPGSAVVSMDSFAVPSPSGPQASLRGLAVVLRDLAGRTVDLRVPIVDDSGRPFRTGRVEGIARDFSSAVLGEL